MGSLAEAYVQLRTDNSMIGSDVTGAVVPAAEKAGDEAGAAAGKHTSSSFTKTIKGLAAGFAMFAVADFVKGSLTAARELAAAQRMTAAVIKSTGGAARVTASDIDQLTRKLSEQDGVQGATVRSGENVLLTFTAIRNAAGRGNDIFNQTTQAALNLSAAMHQDLQSSVVQLGKALSDPVKGLTALHRVGVTFSTQQKEQIALLMKHNNILGAQKIILGEVTKEFGGAAAAATDPAQKAAVKWQDFKEQIGQQLLPVLTQLVGLFVKLLPTVVKIVDAVFNFAKHNKLLTEILGGVTAAMWLLDAAMDANPVGLIVLAIMALVVALVYCWTHFKTFREVVLAVWHAIQVAAESVAHFFTRQIPEAWDWLYEHTKRVFLSIKNFFINDIWHPIINAVHAVVDFFTKTLPKAWDNFRTLTTAAFESVRHDVLAKFDAVVAYFKAMPGRVWAFVTTLPERFHGLGQDIVKGMIKGIDDMTGGLATKVTKMGQGVIKWAKNALGIKSPSAEFALIGIQVGAGMQQGLDASMPSVQRSTTAMVTPPPAPAAGGAGSSQTVELLTQILAALLGLDLTVTPEGLALAVRKGEKRLGWAG
jgi:phage-related protein